LILIRTGTDVGAFKKFLCTYEQFTELKIMWVAGKLLAFQEEICPMEFVCCLDENKNFLLRGRKS
jgi:hypothetical protein